MKRVTDRLYAITTGGCMGLFLIYLFLSSDLVKAQTVDIDLIEISSICVASYSLLSVDAETDKPKTADYFLQEGKWWGAFLAELIEDVGMAKEITKAQVMILTNNRGAGINDYDEYKKLTDICADMRLELQVILVD